MEWTDYDVTTTTTRTTENRSVPFHSIPAIPAIPLFNIMHDDDIWCYYGACHIIVPVGLPLQQQIKD